MKNRFSELCDAYKGPLRLYLAAEYMMDSLFERRLRNRDLLPLGTGGKHLLVETSYFNPPAGLVEKGEEALHAAKRELMEETGISPEHMSVSGQYAENGHTSSGEHISDDSRRSVNKLTNNGSRTSPAILLGVFSDPGRDPRGWTITSLFGAYVGSDAVAKAGDDARDARWFRLTVDDIDSRLVLRLECDDIVLSAECRYELIRTPFGSEYRLEQLTSSNLAFDHAKLIALAYLKYRN